MDSEITSLFDSLAQTAEPGKLTTIAKLAIIDISTGELEITIGDVTHRRVVKPLKELYGPGINAPTVDVTSEEYRPLLMEIERSITEFDQRRSRLTDAMVASALNRMGINPEMDPGKDELVRSLQMDLRVLLSLNDYSRQDLIQAIRKINKSVARHTRADGPRGYLDFISKYVAS